MLLLCLYVVYFLNACSVGLVVAYNLFLCDNIICVMPVCLPDATKGYLLTTRF